MNSCRLNWPNRLPGCCGSTNNVSTSIVFETAESQSIDGPLALFALYPFRCVNFAGEDTSEPKWLRNQRTRLI